MLKPLEVNDLIHISSSEGSYAYYHYFYYQGFFLVLEETYFEHEGLPIYIYFNIVVDGKEVRHNFIGVKSSEVQYLKYYLNKPEVRDKYSLKHPILEFISIEKKTKRQKIVSKLLHDIS